ncbi:MAG: phage anti-repressor protein [Psychrobacter glaciei]|jgi:phage anti-repressor protein
MKYIINNKVKFRKKRWPFIVIFLIGLISLMFGVPSEGEYLNFNFELEEFKWALTGKAFLLCAPIGFICSAFESYQYLKYAKRHTLEISNDGLIINDYGIIQSIPFNLIKSIKLRENSNFVKKFLVKVSEVGEIDLTNYTELGSLKRDLKLNTDERIWK